jgi:NDP-sugar pyrophosphorylase family protein
MRALVIATGQGREGSLLDERHPTHLLPLVDRPFIQHIVEYLEGQGISTFDFILHYYPEQCEHLLGDGTRWNSVFTFHLTSDADHPYRMLKTICGTQEDEAILVAHADRLPCAPLQESLVQPLTTPRLFYWRPPNAAAATAALQWTGWAWVPRTLLTALPEDLDEEAFAAYLSAHAQSLEAQIEVATCLSVRAYDDLLAAHRTVLSSPFPELLRTGREIEPGIWLGRNVSLHPTSRLVPPVYIGENCRVGREVHLGPYAVVGKDCVLDEQCIVEQAVIFPGSYVGEGLEVVESVVDKNRLVNVRLDAAVDIADDFILGNLTENLFRHWLGTLVSRTLALLLFVLTFPMALAVALVLRLTRPGPVLYKRTVVRLPAPGDMARWRTFTLWRFAVESIPRAAVHEGVAGGLRHLVWYVLPALGSIARGHLRFVGVAPRTSEEIQALPSDWRTLYLHAKAGIITEAYVRYGASPSEDELYAAEAFYSVMASVSYDARLAWAYVARFWHGLDHEHAPPHDTPRSPSARQQSSHHPEA